MTHSGPIYPVALASPPTTLITRKIIGQLKLSVPDSVTLREVSANIENITIIPKLKCKCSWSTLVQSKQNLESGCWYIWCSGAAIKEIACNAINFGRVEEVFVSVPATPPAIKWKKTNMLKTGCWIVRYISLLCECEQTRPQFYLCK